MWLLVVLFTSEGDLKDLNLRQRTKFYAARHHRSLAFDLGVPLLNFPSLRGSLQLNGGGQSIETFLGLSETDLDCGYSSQLQKQALQSGSFASTSSFLCPEHVQMELQRVLQALSASNLDVERKHAVDKRQEKFKVRSVATASRNTILQRYKVRRHAAIGVQDVQAHAVYVLRFSHSANVPRLSPPTCWVHVRCV